MKRFVLTLAGILFISSAARAQVKPCCTITALDAHAGTATAKENATLRTFVFKVPDAKLFASLRMGEGVYANFTAHQVSIDGKTACCAIVSISPSPGVTPQSGPAPSPTPSPSATSSSGAKDSGKSNKVQTQGKNSKDLGTSNTEIKANEATTEQAIRAAKVANPTSSGNTGPDKAALAGGGAAQAGTPQGRPVPTLPVFSREKVQVRMLSQGKKWRLQTVSGNVEGRPIREEALYHIVGKEGISEAPIPPQIKNELLRDAASSRGNDIVYIVHKNSAENIAALLVKKGSGSAPPTNNVSQTGSSDNGCNDMFGWGNHVNRTASVSFSVPGDLLMLNLNDQSISYANVSGTVKIKAPTSGHLLGEIGLSVLDYACQPVAFKFRFLHVNGYMEVAPSLDLDAQIGATHEFKTRLAEQHLGGFWFAIGPIPVYIGYDAFLEGRLDVKVPNLAQVKYSVQGNGHGELDAHCDMNGCSATPTGSFNWSTPSGNLTFLAQGVRAVVKPGILGGVEAYLYNPVFVNAHVGIEPYAKGDFWAYSGSCSEHNGGPLDRSYAKALTADIDGGFDVLAGIDASGLAPNGFLSEALLDQEFTVYNWEKHLKFYDLIGSTALTPLLEPNPPAHASQPKTVAVRMRPCYPYSKDKDGNPVVMTYQMGWGDGTSDTTAQAPIGSTAEPSHTWSSTGDFPIQARPLKDSHGREFPAQTTQAHMQVNAASASTAAGLGRGNGSGSKLTAQPMIVPNLIGQNLQAIGANLIASTNPNHLPDLVPAIVSSVGSCSYSPDQSCQQQCPPYTAHVPLGVKNLTPYAISGPIRVTLQDTSGHTVRSWTVNGLAGNGEAYPGSFSYQAQFACPAPGTSTSSAAPSPNYILLVTPPNGVTEFQTNNNSAQLYIRPDATISP